MLMLTAIKVIKFQLHLFCCRSRTRFP